MREKIYLQRARTILKTIRSRVQTERYSFEKLVEKMAEDESLAGGSAFAYMRASLERLVEFEKEIKKDYLESDQLTWDFSETNREGLYSPEKTQIYREINARLWEIEKQLRKDIEQYCRQCQSMIDDGSIDDYEMGCSICFYLDENDPDFIESDDNILANLKFDAKLEVHFQEDWRLGDGENRNEFQNIDDHPLQDEHHCLLFHQLYDHTGIDWDELPRIDSIWVDIKVILQHFYKLKTQDDRESDSTTSRDRMRGE